MTNTSYRSMFGGGGSLTTRKIAGEDLQKGDFVNINSNDQLDKIDKDTFPFKKMVGATGSCHDICQISDNVLFVIYYSITGLTCKARLITLKDDGSYELGTEYTWSAYNPYGSDVFNTIQCIKIDTDKVFIAYGDSNNSNYLSGIIATVSGSTISFGTLYTLRSAAGYLLCSMAIGTNKVILVAAGVNEVICCSVAGTVITAGTGVSFAPADGQDKGAIASFDTDKFIIALDDINYMAMYSVSGTTITETMAPTDEPPGTTVGAEQQMFVYDTNKVIVIFPTRYVTFEITGGGTGLTTLYNSSLNFGFGTNNEFSGCLIDTNKLFIIGQKAGGTAFYGYNTSYYMITITDGIINWKQYKIEEQIPTYSHYITVLAKSNKICTLCSYPSTTDNYLLTLFNSGETLSLPQFSGIANMTASAGTSCETILSGLCEDTTVTYIPGTQYKDQSGNVVAHAVGPNDILKY